MVAQSPLIAALAFGLGLAFILGTAANRLKLPPIVGYLLAGVAVGPFTPGFVADQHLTMQLAEVGVILLMFGVGLHFSFKDLAAVRKVIVPGTVLQVLVATVLGTCAALLFGWPLLGSMVFGLCLSIASTVVVLRSLEDHHAMDTEYGRTAIGWLVVQDLIAVLALVLLPVASQMLNSDDGQALDLAALGNAFLLTIGKLVLFGAIMLVVGRRLIPALLHYIAHTGSRELFRLAVLSLALGVALVAAELFGVSIALGAFFAGMILSESPLSQRATEETLPLRDAFAVLFFVSVGMLFNPSVLLDKPGQLIATLVLVLAGNGIVTFMVCRLFGFAKVSALFVGVALAQIGEFSFILVDLGIGLSVVPAVARDLVLGASIISIIVSPVLFHFAKRWRSRQEKPADIASEASSSAVIPYTQLTGHAVLIGYGRVGRVIADGLCQNGQTFLAIETAASAKDQLVPLGVEVIVGNAVQDSILDAAGLERARIVFVAIPEAFEAGQIVKKIRARNMAVRIIARAHYEEAVDHLTQQGADVVIMGEREIAHAMLAEVADTHENPHTAPAAV